MQSGKRVFERLTEIHRAVADSLGFEEVLDLVVDHAAGLVEADAALLLLADEQGLLRVRASRGIREDHRAFALPREEAVVERLRGALALAPQDSLTAVPVVIDPALQGMLVAVRRAVPGVYPAAGSEAEELLEALANAAAVALIHSRVYDRMRSARQQAEKRAVALMRLQEASVGLLLLGNGTLSHDRLIEILCHVTSAPRGAFWGLDETRPGAAALVSRGTYGFRRTPRNETDRRMAAIMERIDLDSDHPVARAARSMALVTLPDTQADLVWQEISGIWNRTGIRSMLAVPLRARGRLLGVVGLSWHEVDRSAEEETVNTAEVIANQVAATLDTAALVEELSRVNRLKDEFLATLSHELRNPLNVIVGYAEVLTRSPDAQRVLVIGQAADAIRRNALAQAQLVSDLLDLSRLQTGKLAIHCQSVALVPLLADAAEAVRADAEAKGVELEVEPADELLLVEADAVRVRQILWNLLHNAVKFTPGQGRVTVRLRREGEQVRLEVEDTGLGLEPHFLTDVFEMFRQAEAGPSRRHGGLGIGLGLVRQLVELHGGRVRAESEGLGKGSRFTVWLPLRRSPAEAAAGAPGEGGGLAGVRVLVVDDSEDTVGMLARLLETEGAEVTAATSGAEALRLAEETDLDLVLSDLSMPGMDGYELLRELRVRPRTAEVPVLALTGFGQAEDARRTLAAGFSAHLSKPFELEKLLEVVRGVRGRAARG